MLLINQEDTGVFFGNIKHTLRKTAFAEQAEDNIIPRICLTNFSCTINFLFQGEIYGSIHWFDMILTLLF